MRYLLFVLVVAFSVDLTAQNCESFMPMQEGYKWEVTNFNKKGKEENKVLNTISDVSEVEDGVSATVKMVVSDGKEEHESSYKMTCTGSKFLMSMSMFLPQEQVQQMESTESMEVELDMEDMEFPNSLEVGQELRNATMTMVAKMNGVQMMSSTTVIKERKVVDKVSITTAAGTFESFKVEQTSEVKMGFMTREFKSISFIAEGVGVVRSESYDKKGELESYSEITSIN